jgi:hypothetical protein
MAFSRKALKARRVARQATGGTYVSILREGEKAAALNLPLSTNPYQGENADIWTEGYADMKSLLAE